MSILLEALKQKNSRATSSAAAGVSTPSSSITEAVEADLPLSPQPKLFNDSTTATQEPMEDLVAMLAIEPPPGLSWQLDSSVSSAHNASVMNTPENVSKLEASIVSTQAPSLAPLSFDLILPTPKPVPVLDDEYTSPNSNTMTLNAESVDDKVKPALFDLKKSDTETPSNQTSNLIAEQSEKIEVSVNSNPELAATEPPVTLSNESPLKSIRLPVVEKTPLSAKRFLSFSRPSKSGSIESAVPEDALGPKPHQPAKHHVRQPLMVLGGVLVGMGVLGYATLSIWESQQQAHLQQIARYKSQNLTELPERPQIAPQPIENAPVPSSSAPVSLPPVAATGSSTESKETGVSTLPAVKSAVVVNSPRPSVIEPRLNDSKDLNVLDTTRTKVDRNYSGSEVNLVRSQPVVEWLQLAYQAYERADWLQAEQYYRQVLEKQPRQRDALLGMLAITQADGQRQGASVELAEQLRRLYPNDKEVRLATEGVLALSAKERLSETELKQTQQQIQNPSEVSFRLGLTLAEQQRWSEAQAAFFDAVSTSPNNPDYRLNLAVSYDHLGKYRLAVDHYQQFLKISKTRALNTDTTMVQQRIDHLLSFIASES